MPTLPQSPNTPQWHAFGSNVFVYSHCGIHLRVSSVRKDYGYIYGDVEALLDQTHRLLVRTNVKLTEGLSIARLARDLNDRHPDYNWREALEVICFKLASEFSPSRVVGEPTVEIMSNDHLLVRIPTDRKNGVVALDFNGLTRTGGEFNCEELVVTEYGDGANPNPYPLRINLLSQSAREGLVRALNSQFGKDQNWTSLVSIAWSRCMQAFRDQDVGMQIASLPEQEGEDDFLVDQIIPAGEDTIIFGDGSSGKTTLCYAMIAAMALGPDAGGHLSFANFRGKWAPTLIIDYETSGKKARLYVRRVFEGMGIPSDLLEEMPVFFWPAKGTPIWDLVEPLKRFIAKHNIKVIVVDAGGDACGGEPSKEYAALGYFNALDRLGEDLTTITICHMTHADNNESAKFRPYGSRYWHNRARRTWYVHRVQEEDSDEIDIALFCRKVNYGRKPRPISFRLSYIGTTGPIVFRSQDIAVVPEFEDDRPVVDRITEYLRKLMQPDTIANIAGALNIKLETVSGTLYRHKDKRFVNIPAGMGRGAQHKWALMAQGEPA